MPIHGTKQVQAVAADSQDLFTITDQIRDLTDQYKKAAADLKQAQILLNKLAENVQSLLAAVSLVIGPAKPVRLDNRK